MGTGAYQLLTAEKRATTPSVRKGFGNIKLLIVSENSATTLVPITLRNADRLSKFVDLSGNF